MTNFANGQLRTIAERIERIDDEIKERNADKSEIYQEAKGNGFDLKVLKLAIKRKRALDENSALVEETESMVDVYLAAMMGRTPQETAVDPISGAAKGKKTGDSCTRTSETEKHDPVTGEITEPDHDATAPAVQRHAGGVEDVVSTANSPAAFTPKLPQSSPPTDAVKSADVTLIDQPEITSVTNTLSVEEGVASADDLTIPQFLKRDKPKPQYTAADCLAAG